MRYDSSYAGLGVRDAEIKKLYDHDVVPKAQAAAMELS
jgi:hypothetical protein